jgi:predicted outer membrane repeat protein
MTGFISSSFNGPYHNLFNNCGFFSGVWLDGVADGNTFTNCKVAGLCTGFKLRLVQGGFLTRVKDCVITSRDGALDVIDGSNIIFHNNTCEQGGGAVNANSIGGVTAMVTIRGTNYQARRIDIEGNNFGCGIGFVDTGIIIDNAEHCIIDKNVFASGTQPFDIKYTANAKWNNADDGRNTARGSRTTGYSTRADRKFQVQDISNKNNGYWIDVTSFGALPTGYVGSGFEVKKYIDGMVKMAGQVAIGTSFTSPTLLTTLPIAYAPYYDQAFVVPVLTNAGLIRGTAQIYLTAAGLFYVNTFPAGTVAGDRIYFAGVGWQALAKTDYNASDGI